MRPPVKKRAQPSLQITASEPNLQSRLLRHIECVHIAFYILLKEFAGLFVNCGKLYPHMAERVAPRNRPAKNKIIPVFTVHETQSAVNALFRQFHAFSEVHAHPSDAYVDEGAFIAYAPERAFNYRVA